MGSEGVSRPEGNQTLEAERSGRWQRPRVVDLRTSCAVGNRSPRESSVDLGRRTRRVVENSGGTQNSLRGCTGSLTLSARLGEGRPQSRGNGQRQSGIAQPNSAVLHLRRAGEGKLSTGAWDGGRGTWFLECSIRRAMSDRREGDLPKGEHSPKGSYLLTARESGLG
jgi:hypothetical protein